MKIISQNTSFKQNPSVLTHKLGKGVVLLNPDSGKIYSLNDTASFLWRKLSKKRSIKELNYILCENYDISDKKAYKDIKVFLSRYLEYKLIITL